MNHSFLLFTMKSVWLWPITWTRIVQSYGADWKECVPTGWFAARKIHKGSPRTAELDCMGPAGKHRGWRLSQPAASFGREADGRLQSTDFDTALKSVEFQKKNIRHCRPALLFSSGLHLPIWQHLCGPLFVLLSSHLCTRTEVKVLRSFSLFQDLDKSNADSASFQLSLWILPG